MGSKVKAKKMEREAKFFHAPQYKAVFFWNMVGLPWRSQEGITVFDQWK